jgi:intracellular sulfur oxidation DsrE/DsrF family protein
MRGFKLSKDIMADGIKYSETGVIYIIEKQREGWSVIRP